MYFFRMEISVMRMKTTQENNTQVGLVEDVTVVTRERLRIEHERDYDTLTGLYSRRAFQRECEQLFKKPFQLKHAALLMIDLDSLKHTNDTFGHDWGDQYIRRAVSVLPGIHRREQSVPVFPVMSLTCCSMDTTAGRRSGRRSENWRRR